MQRIYAADIKDPTEPALLVAVAIETGAPFSGGWIFKQNGTKWKQITQILKGHSVTAGGRKLIMSNM